MSPAAAFWLAGVAVWLVLAAAIAYGALRALLETVRSRL